MANKVFTRQRIIYMIISLTFAIIFWGFVVADQNPIRIKTVREVSVEFKNTDQVTQNGLIIVSDLNEYDKADVTVESESNLINYINNKNIIVSVDLAKITTPGKHRLKFEAYSAGVAAAVTSINPEYVDLTIDRLVKREIPIEIVEKGSLQDEFFIEELLIEPSEKITIEGAYSYLNLISKAICEVDLSDVNSDFSKSLTLKLIDGDGKVIENEMLMGTLPSVIVRGSVLSRKSVPINIQNATYGTPRSGFSVKSVTASPDKVHIYGEKQALSGIESLDVKSISVSGKNEEFSQTAEIIFPKGVKPVEESSVTLKVNIGR